MAKDFAGASEWYRRGEALTPDQYITLTDLGQFLFETGDNSMQGLILKKVPAFFQMTPISHIIWHRFTTKKAK